MASSRADLQQFLPSSWTEEPVYILVMLQRSERFCENVCDLLFGVNIGYSDLFAYDSVAYEVIADVNVL